MPKGIWGRDQYWRNMKEEYAKLDARIPERVMTHDEMCMLRCDVCNARPRYRFDHYAMTRADPWKILSCDCRGKYLWVFITD